MHDPGDRWLFGLIQKHGNVAAANAGQVEVAEHLGLSEANVKVIIHRSRKRYKDLLKAEVARTVERKDEIDDELKELFAALS